MTIAEKIVKQLKEQHGIEFTGVPTIARTRAGSNQRAAGAWAWFLWSDDDRNTKRGSIGSQHPASLVASNGFTATWHLGDCHLDPHEYVLQSVDLYIKAGGFTNDPREAKRYESRTAARKDQVSGWKIVLFHECLKPTT